MPVKPRGVALLKLFWDRAAAVTCLVVAIVVLVFAGAGDMISVFVRGMLVQLETPEDRKSVV